MQGGVVCRESARTGEGGAGRACRGPKGPHLAQAGCQARHGSRGRQTCWVAACALLSTGEVGAGQAGSEGAERRNTGSVEQGSKACRGCVCGCRQGGRGPATAGAGPLGCTRRSAFRCRHLFIPRISAARGLPHGAQRGARGSSAAAGVQQRVCRDMVQGAGREASFKGREHIWQRAKSALRLSVANNRFRGGFCPQRFSQ